MRSQAGFRGRWILGEFEQACADTERAAAAAAKAAAGLAAAAKQLVKAAQSGDIAKIRKTSESLKLAEQAARQESRNAEQAWPLTPAEEEELLNERYEDELIEAARSRGLKIHRQDDRLVSFPSLLKVLPEIRAVQVDRDKVTALRPKHLVAVLEKNQLKKPHSRPEQFLETLYSAYKLVVGSAGVRGTTLANVSLALTLLPGSAKDYDKTDFARDVFSLDQSHVTTTKSGARVSFHASTGSKGSAHYTFVAPDGTPFVYYGVKFTEP